MIYFFCVLLPLLHPVCFTDTATPALANTIPAQGCKQIQSSRKGKWRRWRARRPIVRWSRSTSCEACVGTILKQRGTEHCVPPTNASLGSDPPASYRFMYPHLNLFCGCGFEGWLSRWLKVSCCANGERIQPRKKKKIQADA